MSENGLQATVLVQISTAVKRYRDHHYSYTGKHLTVGGLQFIGLTHYHRGKKHGCMQADTVLETRVLPLDQQAAGRDSDTGLGLSF